MYKVKYNNYKYFYEAVFVNVNHNFLIKRKLPKKVNPSLFCESMSRFVVSQ